MCGSGAKEMRLRAVLWIVAATINITLVGSFNVRAGDSFPLALAGGVLLRSEKLRSSLGDYLGGLDLRPGSMAEVKDPVLGAVRLAQREA